jgi:hypothetical protein
MLAWVLNQMDEFDQTTNGSSYGHEVGARYIDHYFGPVLDRKIASVAGSSTETNGYQLRPVAKMNLSG